MNSISREKTSATYLDNEFRQLFRNLFFPERVKNINADKWVKYCKDCGATTVFMDAKSQSYVYYDSKFIRKDPILGKRDLYAEFAQAAKKHGLKWAAYIAPLEIESMAGETDDWQQRNADGRKTCENQGGLRRTFFCWNAPGLRGLFANMLAEISAKYHPHGFYIDGVLIIHTACYCETCKALFRKETGKEIPLKPAWNSPDWFTYIRWRNRTTAGAARMIHEAVHKVDPKISVVFNCPYPWCGWYAGQSAAQAGWLDLVGTETGLQDMAWRIGANRMLKQGKSTNVYGYFTPQTRYAEAETWNDLALASGALPCIQEHCNFMKHLFARTRKAEPFLREMVSAADVALHVSSIARDAYYRPNDGPTVSEANRDVFNDRGFYEELRGVFTGLLHKHLPAEMVHLEDGLEETSLTPFRTLIMPNSVYLAPRVIERLQEYVRQGGTLIATMETGLRDMNGVRKGQEILWPGSGVAFKGEIQTIKAWTVKYGADGNLAEIEDDAPATPDQYLIFKEGTKPWLGEDVMLGDRGDGVEVREGWQFHDVPSCQIPANAVEVTVDRNWEVKVPMRFRRDKMKGWEECPAVAIRKLGSGRICYLNFQIGTLIFSTGHIWWKNLLARVIRETAGEGSLRIDAPTCVNAFVWRQPGKNRYVLHLVNELSTSGLTGHPNQLLDRVPVSAKVRIAWPGVKAVKKVVGDAECEIRRAGRAWNVELSNLADRVVLVCET